MRSFSNFLFVAIVCVALFVCSSLVQAESKQQVRIVRGAAGFPPAPAQVELHDTLFNKITAVIVPIINQVASNITIPAISDKHFNVDPIHIDNFDLGPITFTFNAPNQVSVSLSQLSFSIPNTHFELMDKILFVHIHCSGQAYGNVNIAAGFSFNLVDSNGKIALEGTTDVNVDYKTLNIGYKMDHEACKIVAKLINFVIGGITSKIKDAIEKDLGPAIQKSLTKALSDAFAKLPFDITGNPQVNAGVLSVPIDLDSLIHSSSKKNVAAIAAPPALAASTKTKKLGDNVRDIAVVLPESSANTVLAAYTSIGKFHFNHTEKRLTTKDLKVFIPAAYTACPDCEIRLDADIHVFPPTASFTANNFTLSARNISLSFTGVNATAAVFLFTLNVNAGFSVGQFSISQNSTYEVVHFALGVQTIDLSVYASNVGPISDISTINFLINLIINTIVPSFNDHFPGIPIPAGSATGFSLTDILIQVSQGSFSAGFDVSL